MSQQTSRVTVKIDGDTIRSKAASSAIVFGGATVEESDVTSTDQGLTVWKEKFMPAKISTTLVHLADSDLIKLLASREVTVTYETNTGVTYTIANAVALQPGELKDGECDVSFMGDAATGKLGTVK
jgi:hypothetical protein